MKVAVFSRNEIEKVIKDGNFPDNTAVISFYDSSLIKTDPEYSNVDYSGVCERVFFVGIDDIDIDSLEDEGFTYETFFQQADEAAEFIYTAYNDGMDIICQCEYGQSRSAGCAAAILQHFYKNGIDVFTDYDKYPSKIVYHKIFDALENIS